MNKHLVTIILLILAWTCTNAQSDVLTEFWKNIEKRKLLGKDNSDVLTTKYISQILSSCGSRIIFMQQDYVYEKKNLRYVKGYDDYYERVYGVGVSTVDGVVASKHMIQPWVMDNSILASKGYSPVLTNIEVRSFKDTLATKMEEGKYVVSVGKDLAQYSFLELQDSGNDVTRPDTMGLLMLFYRDPERDSLKIKIIEYKPKWMEGVADIDTQLMNKQMVGGFYFNVDTSLTNPDYIITGIISGEDVSEFKIVGLIDHLPIKSSNKTREGSEIKSTNSKAGKSKSSGKNKKAGDEKAKTTEDDKQSD